MEKIKRLFNAGLLAFMLMVPAKTTFSQISEISLQLQAEAILTNSQLIELKNLLSNESGSSSRLLTLILQNQQDTTANNLYLEISISGGRTGNIIESYQRQGQPFSLQAGQTVFATNIDLANGRLPGVDTKILLDGELTPQGRDYFNSLQGSSTLPADEYSIDISIYQPNNSRNGGQRIAHESLSVGSNIIDGDLSLFLMSPGDIPGSDIQISNPYPEFRWEGPSNLEYRLIVVEAISGESAQSLIEGAKSTAAGQSGGSASLMEYENLDIMVNGTSFQYPASGAQPLRNGKTYYWQVYNTILSTSGTTERSSEIWSFRMGSGTVLGVREDIDQELKALLTAVLGNELTNELIRQKFSLESLELDNQLFFGDVAKDELRDLIEKIRSGKIKLVNQL
jgi:hypothetical protein